MVRAGKPCSKPGCPTIVAAGQRDGRCDDCKKAADQARGSAASRGYDARWARRRRIYLSRTANRFCKLCGAPSTVADHHPLSRRQLVALGVADPDADHRLRPLCTPCHGTETATHQPGGWHAQ